MYSLTWVLQAWIVDAVASLIALLMSGTRGDGTPNKMQGCHYRSSSQLKGHAGVVFHQRGGGVRTKDSLKRSKDH